MKVIIAGSRTITDKPLLHRAIQASGFQISEVVSGQAHGVDRMGAAWGRGERIPVKSFYPAWRRRDGSLNKAAGFERNQRMADYADALIALWDGESNGTRDMIKRMRAAGKPVYCIDTSL